MPDDIDLGLTYNTTPTPEDSKKITDYVKAFKKASERSGHKYNLVQVGNKIEARNDGIGRKLSLKEIDKIASYIIMYSGGDYGSKTHQQNKAVITLSVRQIKQNYQNKFNQSKLGLLFGCLEKTKKFFENWTRGGLIYGTTPRKEVEEAMLQNYQKEWEAEHPDSTDRPS